MPVEKRVVNAAKSVYDSLDSKVCAWSGKPLGRQYALDHAIPFCLWKNNDLWNLLPADRQENSSKKDKLPEPPVVRERKDCIIHYWELVSEKFPERFEREAGHFTGRQFDRKNWQHLLFATFAEAIEITAIQRGIERWQPASFAAGGTRNVIEDKGGGNIRNTSFSMADERDAGYGESPSRIVRIVSGGQTGADRGGLDAAIALDIPHGGWCPKGRRAEDGTIPEKYRLKEMKSKDYVGRTKKNVVESSATVIFSDIPPTGGSLKTAQFAEKHRRPCLCVDMTMSIEDAILRTVEWLRNLRNPQITLNVAGSRASKAPQLQKWTSEVITQVVCRLNDIQTPETCEEPETIAIPFFPDIKIACGFLREPATGFEPETMTIENTHRNLDPTKHFIARADGDSMDGGNSPIRHGDLLLLEINTGGTISNQIFAVEYRDTTGDTAYLLKRILKDAPNQYRLKSNNPQYPDIIVQNDSMFPFARLKKVLK